MPDHRTLTLSVSAALAGAVALAIAGLPATAAADQEKCYGISKAGENDCADAAGTHGCAGGSTEDYSGGEYKLVLTGTCQLLGGQLAPFTRVGQPGNG